MSASDKEGLISHATSGYSFPNEYLMVNRTVVGVAAVMVVVVVVVERAMRGYRRSVHTTDASLSTQMPQQ